MNTRYLNKREHVGKRLPGAGVRTKHDACAGQHGRNTDALDLGGLRDAHLPQRGHCLLPEPELLEALHRLNPPLVLLQMLRGPLPAPRLLPRRLRRSGGGVLEVAEAEALEEELVAGRGRGSGEGRGRGGRRGEGGA